jgi:hypothetical protein
MNLGCLQQRILSKYVIRECSSRNAMKVIRNLMRKCALNYAATLSLELSESSGTGILAAD